VRCENVVEAHVEVSDGGNATFCVGAAIGAFFRLVFFFQAEDGIRDGHVTGVQTCALPICRRHPVGSGSTSDSRVVPPTTVPHTCASIVKSPACGRSRQPVSCCFGATGWRSAPIVSSSVVEKGGSCGSTRLS